MQASFFSARPGTIVLAALLASACGDTGEEGAADSVPIMDEPSTEAAPAPAATAETERPATGALPAGVTAEMVQQGQQIFTTATGICYTCHMQDGTGGPLAPDLTDGEWLWIEPGPDMHEQLVTLIKTGVSQPKEYPAPMPALGGTNLSDEQVRAVAAYVASLSGSQ